MKTIIKVVFIVLGVFSLANAQVSIDTQIQAIKNAPPSERSQMMNALKVRLSNMNSQDRSDAISQLRTQMRFQNANNQQQMQGMQLMNQKQAGTQYMNNDLVQGTPSTDTGSIMPFGKH